MELPVSMGLMRRNQEEVTSYPSSWINHLTTWIDDLPGPAWCYYLALLIVVAGGQLLVAWWEGSYRPAIIGFTVVLSGSSIYYLAMIHYLDKGAGGAFAKFQPALSLPKGQAAELGYQLTHLPARPVRALTLVGFTCAVLMIAGVDQGLVNADQSYFGRSMLAQLYWRMALIADQLLFWNLIFHTIHQLRTVNLIYTKYVNIDLFNLSPLYSFSRMAAYTAASTVFIAYLWLATYPWLSSDYLVMGSWLIGIPAAMASFILPLLGIHHRLVEEKARWKGEVAQHLKTNITNFHKMSAEHKLEEVDLQLRIIEGINREKAILEQIPTWPWQPGTLRGLTTSVLVPILLWLVVKMLEHIVRF